jgi:hypothetical protein
MLVFGGQTNDGLAGSETWSLSLTGSTAGSWSLLPIEGGDRPWPRAFHVSVVDERRRRMLVFGGLGPWTPFDHGPGGLPTDTVLWSLALEGRPRWSVVRTAGEPPAPADGHAIYDPTADRVLIVGDGVTSLTLTGTPTFSVLTATVPLGAGPLPPVIDSAARRLLVITSRVDASVPAIQAIWALSLDHPEGWTQIAQSTPAEGVVPIDGGVIYDDVGDRLIAVSARDGVPIIHLMRLQGPGPLAWVPDNQPAHGIGLSQSTVVWDSTCRQMIFFGGIDAHGVTNRVRNLLMGGFWADWAPLGSASDPDSRYLSSGAAAYDAKNHRAMVHGGYDQIGPSAEARIFDGLAWTTLSTINAGPSLMNHSAIQDVARDRTLVFGGYGPGWTPRNAVFALEESSQWTELSPAGSPPPPRGQHAAAYDPAGDAMLIFGGHDASKSMNDVWRLSLGPSLQWTELHPSGTPPPAEQETLAAYDAAGRRWFMLDAKAGAVFSLSLDPLEWSEINAIGTPSPGAAVRAVYQAARQRLIAVWANADTHQLELWALLLSGPPEWRELCPGGVGPGSSSAAFETTEGVLFLGGGAWRLDADPAPCP